MLNHNAQPGFPAAGRLSEIFWNALTAGRKKRLRRSAWRNRASAAPVVERLEERTLLSSVSGVVYHDLNENGAPDGGELLLEKWVVFSDLNRNGQLDAEEPSTRADAMGRYTLDDLMPGEHAIVAQQNPGWRPTFPTDAGTLETLDVLQDGVDGADGLSEPRGSALSPNGQNMYVADLDSDSLAVYSRDPLTGELTFVEIFEHGVDGVDGLDAPNNVQVSPDGQHVYVTAEQSHAVAVFARDADNGQLTFLEAIEGTQNGDIILEEPAGLSISHDGAHVYVGSRSLDSVTVFERDSDTGHLAFVEIHHNGVDGISGLGGANTVAVSPDDQYVYAGGTEDDALVVFERDEETGQLTLVETIIDDVDGIEGLGGIDSITVSPDSRHVYVASRDDHAVAVFHRNEDGTLTLIDLEHESLDADTRLNSATAVSVSPDGLNVYVVASGDNAVNVFSRDPATGLLTFEQVLEDGVNGVDGLAGTSTVLVSNDGRQVYASSNFDDALVAFTRVRPGEQLVELAADEDVDDVDFGSTPLAAANEITGRVWLDANANGIQDEGEFGIPNTNVMLQSTATDFDDPESIVTWTVATDSEGNYRFEFFGGERRRVVFHDFPTVNDVHFGLTPPEQGGDDTLDSDVNPTTGYTPEIVLTGGGSASSVDAGMVPITAPVLRAPVVITFDTTPTFEWSQALGGARYDIWVNNQSTGQSGIIRNMNVEGTEFTPSEALPVGHRFIWTVRAFNAAGEPGPWAPHRTFSTGVTFTPQGTAPPPQTIDTTPEFAWTPIPGVERYDLWVNDLNTGQSGIIRTADVTEARYEPPVPLTAGHRYVWTVQGITDNGAKTEWAPHRYFTIHFDQRPTLLGPPGRTLATAPQFAWTEIPGADRYDIWVNDLTTGQFGVIRKIDVSGPTFIPETPLVAGHDYVWTVRGLSDEGGASQWAHHAYFSVDLSMQPTPIGPTGIIADATPTFLWTPVPGADHYDLWVNNQTTGQSGIIRVTDVPQASYVPPNPLPGTDRFIWTVRPINSSGDPGEWAPHRTFRFVSVGTPTVLGPGGTVSTQWPVFRWQSVPGAARYEVWVNDQTTGEVGIIRTANITGTAFQPTNSLPNFHRYIWTVRAITAGGVTGPWSPHWGFSTGVTQTTTVLSGGAGMHRNPPARSESRRPVPPRLRPPSDFHFNRLGRFESDSQHESLLDRLDVSGTNSDESLVASEPPSWWNQAELAIDSILARWPETDWWEA